VHIKANWHGTSWIAEVIATGIRDGKPFKATHRFITSLRTTPEALLRLVRERWSLESWHWIRDTQLREDDHRYRGNGAGVRWVPFIGQRWPLTSLTPSGRNRV
jgi:predicted transposase YbfD/YdcC